MKFVIVLYCYLAFPIVLLSQEIDPQVLSTSGSSFTTNNIQLDWTLGEMAITSIQNSSLQITQGFHQPYYVITLTKELPIDIGVVSVFPNPTAQQVEVRLDLLEDFPFAAELIDVTGKLIWKQNFQSNTKFFQKDLRALPSGVYFLNLTFDQNRFRKVVKVQKIR